MARRRRIHRKGFCHHVMLRGAGGLPLFLDNSDRIRFCLYLQEACERHLFAVHGFCLMSNHIHLIMEPVNTSLSVCEHSFAARYAQYFNRRHNRRGYLYQGRFRSIIVENSAYLRRLIRYIHLNPVEAGLVAHPEAYKWSSAKAYNDLDCFTWLETDLILGHFSETATEARTQMIKYIEKGRIEGIANDRNEILSAVAAYGSREFLNECKHKDTEINVSNNEINSSEDHLKELLDKVCSSYDLQISDVLGSSKNKKMVDARSVLAVLPRINPKIVQKAMAKLLGKSEGSISRLAARAEQQSELISFARKLFEN